MIDTHVLNRGGAARTAPADRLAHIIHDGSSRNRAVALRDGHAEPRDPEAYLNSTSRERKASLPTEGSSQQRLRDCSRSAHE